MKKIILLSVLIIGSTPSLYSQGCSDAGICTISTGQKEDTTQHYKNTLETGYTFAKGLEDVTYNNAFIAFTRAFSKKWSLNTRVTYNQASGKFGTSGQFGDIFLVANYTRVINKKSLLKPSFGLKIPFTSANLKINNIALPMDYQPTLGTFDALFGIDYTYKKWNFDAALQLPVWQTNRNAYFDEYSVSNDFPTTNLFRRKPDMLLRAAYTFTTKNEHWSFRPNILGVYHMGNDTYEDVFGKKQTIKKSEGLTINAAIITDFEINSKNSLRINVAAPLLIREIRPDGLTRAFVTSLSYQYKFK